MHLTSNQLRAARALLNISQQELADKTGVALPTIKNFESGKTSKLQDQTEQAIIKNLSSDIEFIGDGVRLVPTGVEIFDGPDRFEDFYDFLYGYLEQHGGDVCLSIADERAFEGHRTKEAFAKHRRIFRTLVDSKKVTFRVMTGWSKFWNNPDTYAEYRCQPASDNNAAPVAFYAFGDCLALVSFDGKTAPYVVVHKGAPFAKAYRESFDKSWIIARKPPKDEE